MKKIPKFSSQDTERTFWGKHDATDFIDFSNAKVALFPNLKPSAKTISLRLPESLLDAIKVMANQKDIPYQSLMKILLAESVMRKSNLRVDTIKRKKKAG